MKPVALILGASSGMGFACAQRFAEAGFDLILLYRARKSEARQAEAAFAGWRAQGLRIWSYNRDALQEETLKSTLQEAQSNGLHINVLIHSIAKGNLKAIAPAPEALKSDQNYLNPTDFQLTINAMAISYFTWSSALFHKSLLAPEASLLALTSEGARKAWRHYGAVSAAKAALEAINRQLALELGPYGHRANILQPGVTDTPALRMIPNSDQLIEMARKRNPRGELTKAQEVAEVAFALSQKQLSWINGAVIPVDGGESIV